MQWIAQAQMIEQRNRNVNRVATELVKDFQKDGFGCVLLKGQGNALYYTNPLACIPGDIDIWLRAEGIMQLVISEVSSLMIR